MCPILKCHLVSIWLHYNLFSFFMNQSWQCLMFVQSYKRRNIGLYHPVAVDVYLSNHPPGFGTMWNGYFYRIQMFFIIEKFLGRVALQVLTPPICKIPPFCQPPLYVTKTSEPILWGQNHLGFRIYSWGEQCFHLLSLNFKSQGAI